MWSPRCPCFDVTPSCRDLVLYHIGVLYGLRSLFSEVFLFNSTNPDRNACGVFFVSLQLGWLFSAYYFSYSALRTCHFPSCGCLPLVLLLFALMFRHIEVSSHVVSFRVLCRVVQGNLATSGDGHTANKKCLAGCSLYLQQQCRLRRI